MKKKTTKELVDLIVDAEYFFKSKNLDKYEAEALMLTIMCFWAIQNNLPFENFKEKLVTGIDQAEVKWPIG